jgi:tripartite-type tricarboxylate transporter receptor subunit TctC
VRPTTLPRRTALAALAALATPAFVRAQGADANWPARPVKLIVPFTPGLAGEMLAHMAGIRVTHVPYKGSGSTRSNTPR